MFIRGDTDFSLTENFDRWSLRSIFVFGMDARENLIKIADAIDETQWELFEREAKYTVKTKNRNQPVNVKDQVVKQRKFKKIQTEYPILTLGMSKKRRP